MQVEEKAGLPLATWYRTMRWLQRVPQAAALHLSQSQGFEHSEGGGQVSSLHGGYSGRECMLTARTVSSTLILARRMWGGGGCPTASFKCLSVLGGVRTPMRSWVVAITSYGARTVTGRWKLW